MIYLTQIMKTENDKERCEENKYNMKEIDTEEDE